MCDHDVLIKNLQAIRAKMQRAYLRRKGDADGPEPTLIAVSKGHPSEAIRVLYDNGVRDFGESYVPEWMEKKESLPDDIRWHYIGRLQSNKAKEVVNHVTLIHSVDRDSLIHSLERRAVTEQNVLLQIHIGDDENKGGVTVKTAEEILEKVIKTKYLVPRGVMLIPPYEEDLEVTRTYFQTLVRTFHQLKEVADREMGTCSVFTEVSMGMSSDFEVAIEEGATLVRVGSELFGPRDTP